MRPAVALVFLCASAAYTAPVSKPKKSERLSIPVDPTSLPCGFSGNGTATHEKIAGTGEKAGNILGQIFGKILTKLFGLLTSLQSEIDAKYSNNTRSINETAVIVEKMLRAKLADFKKDIAKEFGVNSSDVKAHGRIELKNFKTNETRVVSAEVRRK